MNYFVAGETTLSYGHGQTDIQPPDALRKAIFVNFMTLTKRKTPALTLTSGTEY